MTTPNWANRTMWTGGNLDHVIARNKGGTDHPDNLQLLCNACNSKKGNHSQAELIAGLRAEGVIS